MAVLSPSAGLPAIYPHVYELGLRRLRDQLGLVPVEYPTTRAAHVLRHLDDEVLATNPKPFFGYSDNTNLLHHLYRLHGRGGVAFHGGFHGGSVLVHLGRPGAMHPLTLESLHAALSRRTGPARGLRGVQDQCERYCCHQADLTTTTLTLILASAALRDGLPD
ncbi:LD-carboxypeptidase [Solwaraspora sp. WMMD406]|uniref:LD-carboxypeptidase n=1 Tax=Solwaraspora sp. WMMD406 TaxID=3016095 RepID=UPI0024161C90|nr:LD-carboxypeptidase [Solwaraspora sp. WMMD406]MDG4763814.1 LD-carboxypeptidase [Solwaraspora sp. WMMD406]